MDNKLQNLPQIYCITIEESEARRKNYSKQFEGYKVDNYKFTVFKRFREYSYEVSGPRVHELHENSFGPVTSHLKFLEWWTQQTSEEVCLVTEDDLSLSSVGYWNFTWEEFYNSLPSDWDAVQLCRISPDCSNISFREREITDWGAYAYIIKRSYAEKLVSRYIVDNRTFILDIPEPNPPLPIIENTILANMGKVYNFPLFLEDVYNTETTFQGNDLYKVNGQGEFHFESHHQVLGWWKNIGKYLTLSQIMIPKIEHIYEQEQFGENWFGYQDLYSRMVDTAPARATFVEVGSWKGKSSAYMAVEIANSHKKIEFFCVDTWEGSVEHTDAEDVRNLYHTFTDNMAPLKAYHVPKRTTSVAASEDFEDGSLDFVFIDASHEYEDVKEDIRKWLPKVKPGGVLAGHDYYLDNDFFPGVKQAVNESFDKKELEFSDNCWIYNVPAERDSATTKVLFLENSKDDLWEVDYILDTILGDVKDKDSVFATPQHVLGYFDVLVYNCRKYGFNDVLNVVKRVKPKIIIHLSDEYAHEQLNEYNSLGDYCELFLRQHHHAGFEYTDNTVHIPLGYFNGARVDGAIIPYMSQREYNWAWVGEVKNDRQEMLEILSNIENNFVATNLHPSEMGKKYLQAKFVPCGRGNSSLNCFRLYEASMSGAIPCVVGSKEEIAETFKYEQNPPWIFGRNWYEVLGKIELLLEDEEKLQEIQTNLLKWWSKVVKEVKNKVNSVLKKALSNADLITALSLDPDNSEKNFSVASWYEEQGHTAPAHTYYLRAAERAEDPTLAYKSLLRCSLCYKAQGSRDSSEKVLLDNAVMLLSNRPEAYYFLSNFYSRKQDWQSCYIYADLGIKCYEDCEFTPVVKEYPGIQELLYIKSNAAWLWGKGQEARDLLWEIVNNYWDKCSTSFKKQVEEAIARLGAGPFSQGQITYLPSMRDRLKHSFNGIEKVSMTFSQALQDLFVLTALDGKEHGTFLEVGGAKPFERNNTALLEEKFSWTGVSVEIKNNFVKEYREKRPNIKVYEQDALTIDYRKLLQENFTTKNIDYLQLDIEPTSNTYECLLKIPFDEYKFAVITYEHDYYVDVERALPYRERSRQYLSDLGYVLIVGNVAVDDVSPFEDWWVHPDLVDSKILKKLSVESYNLAEVTNIKNYFFVS